MAADKKLNSVNLVNDASYVYAETASGETVKISKANLASVVAGVINPLINRGDILNIESADDILNTGIYNMRASGGMHTGIMLVFRYDNTCVQIQFGTPTSNVGTPLQRFRYMPAWTNKFTDWFNL